MRHFIAYTRRAGHVVTRPLNCGVMRHVSRLGALLVSASLAACSATRPYAQTAATLSASQRQWVPLKADDLRTGTQAEIDSATDLEACVSGFSQQLARVREEGYRTRVPSREARVLELLECMGTKGWRFWYNPLLEEISVTSR